MQAVLKFHMSTKIPPKVEPKKKPKVAEDINIPMKNEIVYGTYIFIIDRLTHIIRD